MDIEQPPRWAYTWCYFFAVVGSISLIVALLGLLMSPKEGLYLNLILCSILMIESATFFTFFWMCRASLKPYST